MNGAPGYHSLSPERAPMSPPPETSGEETMIERVHPVTAALLLASATIALLAIYGAVDLVLRLV